MKSWTQRIGCSAVVAATAFIGLSTATSPAVAQDASYKGETLTVIIRSNPGGGYDFYGRLMSRHMPKYLPGNPESIVQNMSGAGGIVAANYMQRRAKRDGTEIAVLARDFAIAQRVGANGVAYDAKDLIPIGSPATEVWAWVARGDLPVKDLTELATYDKTVKFSGTGPGSGSVQKVRFLRNEGMPVEVVTGYDGTEEKVLAIIRGEVDATSGSYGTLKQFVKEEGLKPLGRIGKHPDLAHVPDVRDILSEDGKAIARLMAASQVAGRPFVTAPEVPAARVKLLRTSFREALKDPQLLKEAARAKRPISFVSGEEMAEIYRDVLDTPDRVVDEFKKLM